MVEREHNGEDEEPRSFEDTEARAKREAKKAAMAVLEESTDLIVDLEGA